MSHGDLVTRPAPSFNIIATTSSAPVAAVAHSSLPFYGIQFHPEVTHTVQGSLILKNFAVGICKALQNWTMSTFVQDQIAKIQQIVGPTSQVIGAVSGGVDSTVAAKLMSIAIGDRFHAVLVDNGVMRLNECSKVKQVLQEELGINLRVVDASMLFMQRLAGVTDPEKKRKIIGNTFIDVFDEQVEKIEALIDQKHQGPIEFLLQGTLYPDVIESISFKGPSATIKTHHVTLIDTECWRTP
jgi:GMP synthase (glutamine-hydrolysing)